jgi:hypothetical protein
MTTETASALEVAPPAPNSELAAQSLQSGKSLNDDGDRALESRQRTTSPLATGINILKSYMGSGLLGYAAPISTCALVIDDAPLLT